MVPTSRTSCVPGEAGSPWPVWRRSFDNRLESDEHRSRHKTWITVCDPEKGCGGVLPCGAGDVGSPQVLRAGRRSTTLVQLW